MILKRLSILNYQNIAEAALDLSPMSGRTAMRNWFTAG